VAIDMKTGRPSALCCFSVCPARRLGFVPRETAFAFFVNGEHLVRDGGPLKLDAERILAAATQATGRLTNVGA
jgi:hypothetical protein